MFHRADIHRLLLAVLSAVVLCLTALVLSPSAAAKLGGQEPCVTPDGLPLNVVYRVPFSIVSPACTKVRAGERWSASVPWIMNTSFAKVPSGFVTDWGTPLDDFRGKLQAVEYFIDPGTSHGSNFSFPNSMLWVGELAEAAGLPAVNTVSLGALAPLPVGQHAVDVYWRFAAQHCDGFAANAATNCLPAGQTRVRRITFEVVAP